jgi:hypothetical protein
MIPNKEKVLIQLTAVATLKGSGNERDFVEP